MLPIHSILAVGAEKVYQLLPYIVAGVCGALILIGFIVGFCKGFRRVGRGGFIWLAAGGAFFIFVRKGAETPVMKALTGKFGENGGVFALALLCVAAALALYGVLCLIFPPKFAQTSKKSARDATGLKGVEYDDEAEDYDDCETPRREDVVVRGGYRRPNIFGRIFGGVFCALNVATILLAALSLALLVVDCTRLKEIMSGMYEIELGGRKLLPSFMPYISAYALDFIFIGIVVGIALAGKSQGFMESLRLIVVKIGGIAAAIGCFYLPFSAYANADGGVYLLSKIVERCTAMMTSLGLGGAAAIVGKLLSGLLLCAFVCIVLALLNWILKGLVFAVDSVGFLRSIDGALSCLAYAILGVAVALLIWAALYLLNFYGLVITSKLFTQHASVTQGLFEIFDARLAPILENVNATLKSFFGNLNM